MRPPEGPPVDPLKHLLKLHYKLLKKALNFSYLAGPPATQYIYIQHTQNIYILAPTVFPAPIAFLVPTAFLASVASVRVRGLRGSRAKAVCAGGLRMGRAGWGRPTGSSTGSVVNLFKGRPWPSRSAVAFAAGRRRFEGFVAGRPVAFVGAVKACRP